MKRRMLPILLLGFSSGLPIALIGSTLQAWLATEKVSLAVIGIFSLVNLPYNFKFIWAPFMDRFQIPRFGRRKGWIILTQVCLILTLSGMAFCNPVQTPILIGIIALFVAFFSASQDIVVDAFKTEILMPSEFGTGAAVANLGYRVAMLFSGAFALILSDHMSWRLIYLLMAAFMSVGLVATLLTHEPPAKSALPKTLKEAVIEPFLEFFRRRGSFELVSFIILYKLDVVFALALMTPFFMSLGFSKTDIGAITKVFGLIATLSGTFAGGVWLSRLGIRKSLWTFGILQGISGLCFYELAKLGHHYSMLVITIAAENFFSGMGNAAYFAFMMSLCNPKFTATQFALLTSLMSVTRTLAGTPTGWLAQSVGWESYFLISISLALPSLLLLTRFKNWQLTSEAQAGL